MWLTALLLPPPTPTTTLIFVESMGMKEQQTEERHCWKRVFLRDAYAREMHCLGMKEDEALLW